MRLFPKIAFEQPGAPAADPNSGKEMRRTCDRCGNVWYVTKKEARMRAPNAMQEAGLKMQSFGKRNQLIGGKKKAMIAEQRLSRLQGTKDRVEQISRCSECGSISFTQVAV